MKMPLPAVVKWNTCAEPTQHPEQLRRCAELAAEVDQKRTDRIVICFLLALFLLLQSCLAVTNYSGHQTPPMFGDFEAQRHWMELTVNLPTSQWYSHDLEYWGLDYPPLTAYHSWLLAKISQRINSTWMELHKSRGIEQVQHKLFMRLSVIATMMALYAPALVLLFRRERRRRAQSDQIYLGLAQSLLYPGLLFVDCAHFQYNHFSLGLFLWSILAFDTDKFAAGSVLFVLALNHKQMELYHALPISVFLFARSIRKCPTISQTIGQSLINLFRLAFVVFVTFSLLWLPFLAPDPSISLQVLKRLFPVDRGLFEDKVANFWCSTSILIKFKQLYSTAALLKVSTFLVLLTSAPTLVCLFWRPNRPNFRSALTSCALSFFLFSFQVHEKSILLVAIPALLLLNDENLRRPTGLFLSATCFSLYPLCLKDDVAEMLPFFAFYHLLGIWIGRQPMEQGNDRKDNDKKEVGPLLHLLESLSFPAALGLCLLQLFFAPPARYPHLFPLLNALCSFSAFCAFGLWLNFQTLKTNWAAASWGGPKKRGPTRIEKEEEKRKKHK